MEFYTGSSSLLIIHGTCTSDIFTLYRCWSRLSLLSYSSLCSKFSRQLADRQPRQTSEPKLFHPKHAQKGTMSSGGRLLNSDGTPRIVLITGASKGMYV